MAEALYVRAKTSVWWYMENCQVPEDVDARRIWANIISALYKLNYRGPISISAYGDPNRIPDTIKQALYSSIIDFHHVPDEVKGDAIDKKIVVDMLLWSLDNPAPANVMFISSGDTTDYFAYALNRLALRRYNILMARLSFGGNDHSPISGSDMSVQLECFSLDQYLQRQQSETLEDSSPSPISFADD